MRRFTAVLLVLAVMCLSAALAQAADADAIAGLIENLLSTNYVVSTQASKDLVEIGVEVIPHIAEHVLNQPGWQNRLKGITVLRGIGAVEGIPYLMQLLNDEQQGNRTYANDAIVEIMNTQGEKAEQVLSRLLVSDQPVIRNTAKEMLIKAGWTSMEVRQELPLLCGDRSSCKESSG